VNNYKILEQLHIPTVIDDFKDQIADDTIYLNDVKKAGDNLMVTCPYHAGGTEENVSMGIRLNETEKAHKGTCHCFTCGKTVDLIELISFVSGYNDGGDFGNRWIHKNYLVYDDESRDTVQILKEFNEKPETYVSNTVVKKYSSQIPLYVINRGISVDVASYFNVGYDPEEQAAIFPVYDENGICRFLQRRMINYKFFRNDKDADKDKALYGHYHLMEQIKNDMGILDIRKLYVVESIIDALYLWSQGKSAVATLQAIPTKRQLELIEKIPINVVVAAQDNDDAGNRGAKRLKEKINGKMVKRLQFPDNAKDVNDILPEVLSELNETIIF